MPRTAITRTARIVLERRSRDSYFGRISIASTHRTATIGNVQRASRDAIMRFLLPRPLLVNTATSSAADSTDQHFRVVRGNHVVPRKLLLRCFHARPRPLLTCHRCTQSRTHAADPHTGLPVTLGLVLFSLSLFFSTLVCSHSSAFYPFITTRLSRGDEPRTTRLPSVGATDQLCTAYRPPRCSRRLPSACYVDRRESRKFRAMSSVLRTNNIPVISRERDDRKWRR